MVAGASMALRRKFSASSFLADVRRYGCTWFNYIGKPLAYVLATPEQPDDADNPLRVAMGNESTHADVVRFSARFGLHVFDGYGATESGLNILRTPETPPNAMGPLPEGVAVLHQESGEPAAVARFDDEGRLLNAAEAVGEMVNTNGAGGFLGYYGDEEAESERMRGGMYRSGDLAYVDERGFAYFAGRTSDWLRVDGENLATAPIERLLLRHPDVAQVAVYGVPNPDAGDDVMSSVVLREGAEFDPGGVRRLLDRAARPGHQMGAPLRAGHRGASVDPDEQGAQARPRRATMAHRGPAVVAHQDARRPTGRWMRPTPTRSRPSWCNGGGLSWRGRAGASRLLDQVGGEPCRRLPSCTICSFAAPTAAVSMVPSRQA